jgi:hypothetical protein
LIKPDSIYYTFNGVLGDFYEINWKPKDILVGVYFCHITSDGKPIARKLVFLK